MKNFQRIFLVSIFSLLTFHLNDAFALPQGEQIVSGDASFIRQGNDTLNIFQQTDRLIADYQSFSIGAPETVNFFQPNSASVALNRVVGSDPSSILGHLTSNGKIFLINPNGIVFGSSARVDTGSLIASTLDIDNVDFNQDRLRFTNAGAGVVNSGQLNSPGGYVVLLGSQVSNQGFIQAPLGSVALVAGDATTVGLDAQGLISVVINQPVKGAHSGDAVSNQGEIHATGGKVVLSAQTLKGAVNNVVNNSGIITANSLVNKNGEIYLLAAGDDSTVVNTGSLDVSAQEHGADGGFVELSADRLNPFEGKIDASFLSSGNPGTVLFDPDFFIIDDDWQDLFSSFNGADIIVQADLDVSFDLTDNQLDLVNFDVETFRVHAGRDIYQNGDALLTHGGHVAFLSEAGDIHLSGDISTSGGNVDLEARAGDVIHSGSADVATQGGNFRGRAGGDYIFYNGAIVDTNQGVLDVYAHNNIVLGNSETGRRSVFEWEYVSGDRTFHFLEFGYYLRREDGGITYVALSQGDDIGKDNTSLLSGGGSVEDVDDFELYTVFDQGPVDEIWHYHTDASLNEDQLNHVLISSDRYSWEDIFTLGDRDFNDAVIDFSFQTIDVPAGVRLSSESDLFLTANSGSIQQTGGLLESNRMMLSSNMGISGTGANDGLTTDAGKISALNKTSGDIRINNARGFEIADLSGVEGLNPDVTGQNGVVNNALLGKIDVFAGGDLLINAPVESRGDIRLEASGDIVHTSDGNVTIDNAAQATLGPPENVSSPSHQTSTWSNDSSIDVTWQLPVLQEGCCADYSAIAHGDYTMLPGSRIVTDNGNATLEAGGDIALSLIDSGNGHAHVQSLQGSIIDADLQSIPADYDVIGRNIQLLAPNGSVGGDSAGEEIDSGYPLGFSFMFDNALNSSPDQSSDAFQATLDSQGDWLFSTTFQTPFDSAGWWFHIATVDEVHALISESVHLGPFLIDTVAPVISAAYDDPNIHGWFNHDVEVDFSAQDELSGFAPNGELTMEMASKTSSGEGLGLTVTSDGIADRAGNQAVPISVVLNVDKTAPVIIAGSPQGLAGENGTFLSDVSVPFSATDNLSGFSPDGRLQTDLATQTTTGHGDDLFVTSDGISDLADNLAPGITSGPFTITVPVPIQPLPIPNLGPQVLDNVFDFYRVYYEILNPSQFLSFEPVAKIGLYAYHPVAQMDDSAFNDFTLDAGAYEFIENDIKLRRQLPSYFE